MKAFSRWANRNPLIAIWLGFIVCFALLLVAHAWEVSDMQALRLQMAATARSTT